MALEGLRWTGRPGHGGSALSGAAGGPRVRGARLKGGVKPGDGPEALFI